MEHFNELTPQELEVLAILSEEMGEAQQIIGKILRHGYDSCHPDSPTIRNRDLLAKEIADVLFAIELIKPDIIWEDVLRFKKKKAKKIKPYLHHQGKAPQ